MPESQIYGGYILLARQVVESGIMDKPPLYLKVWVWILTQAAHKPYKNLDRGEVFTTISRIQEAMSYYVGYRKETPSYKQIRQVLDWLKQKHERTYERRTKGTTKGTMIVTTKGTQGFKITVCNYKYFQTPENYERHSEGHDESYTKVVRTDFEGHNKNKNYNKNYNNKEKEIYKEKEKRKSKFTPPTIDEVKEYIQEKQYRYVDAEKFWYFYESKDWYVGKNKMKDWKKALSGWEARHRPKEKTHEDPYKNIKWE